jgi:hypothetical protein
VALLFWVSRRHVLENHPNALFPMAARLVRILAAL